MLSLSDMQGLWSRSLLVRPDGVRDTTTWVAWLQGPTLFADLRQPPGRPSFDDVHSLGDLSHEQVAWLAEQEGFAGRLEQDGEFFVWRRAIDFQPQAQTPDSGRLYLDGSVMIEEGRHSAYIEHWHRERDTQTPCAAAWLFDGQSGCDGFLVRTGTAFMHVRAGLSSSLPAGATLRDCVSAAPSIAAARAMVNCEISFGHVAGSDWVIERSSLPYREGVALDVRPSHDEEHFSTADVAGDGSPMRRVWAIAEIEGDKGALMAPAGASALSA